MSVKNTPRTAATVVGVHEVAAVGIVVLVVLVVVSHVEIVPICTQEPQRLGSFGPRQPALPHEEWQLVFATKERERERKTTMRGMEGIFSGFNATHKTHRNLFRSAVSPRLEYH